MQKLSLGLVVEAREAFSKKHLSYERLVADSLERTFFSSLLFGLMFLERIYGMYMYVYNYQAEFIVDGSRCKFLSSIA